MPPRRKSALEDLITSGLVADGELLRYKSKQGQLMGIGRAREGGVEVDGTSKLLGYGQFEEHAGSKVRRPAEHTHTSSSRTLQGLQLMIASDGGGSGGGRAQRKAAAEPALDLLEDENDDLCHACGLGGHLLCCETCPAVYHPSCVGLQAPPDGDFYCPACRCTQCGDGGSESILPTGCHWLDCSAFRGPGTLQDLPRPHVGPAGVPPVPAPAATAQGEGEGDEQKMEVEQKPEAADFWQLVAAAQAEAQQVAAPPEAAAAAQAARGAAAAAPGGAAVHCAATHGWAHVRCFPPEFGAALRESSPSQPCISSAVAITACTRMAAACAAGVLPLGNIVEGARASGSGANGSADARAPLPVSLLVVRGAAVAAPGTCRGYAPAYSPDQQEQLQAVLSAALHVVHSCYAPIPDSRTGADIIPWLLRGAVLGGGAADFSATHAALLLLGEAVAGVAVFRSFGAIAELPLLAVRPELQRRNGLGGLLLAAVEHLLLQAGAQWLFTPAFTADGQPYLPHRMPPPAGGQQDVAPALLQGKWGYGLAPAEQALAAASHPLVPGLSPESPWNQKALDIKYSPLAEDLTADVVVIGAGIAGLTCAYQLAKEAHIMSWLDDYYYECASMHGEEKTKVVAHSLHGAADWIEKVCREEGIECQYHKLDGYLFPHVTGESPQPTSASSALNKEIEAAIKPWEVGGIQKCLRFPNNAEFHPLMYLEGLAKAVERRGGKIYEGTKAWTFESGRVQTTSGHTIRCSAHVMATNSPCNHNLAVHARQLPYRSYAVGILIKRDKVKRALYWDTAEPYHYVRFEDWDSDNLLLIVGGEDHKTGSLYPYDPYARLEKYARSRWTDAGEVLLRWNGQVMEPADLLYLHGRNPLVPDGNEYIITGDSGQGMTGGTIGGIVCADLILGRRNPWAEVYDPSRAPPLKSLPEIIEEGAVTTASFVERVLPVALPKGTMEAGSGQIVQKGLHKVAVYCDDQGQEHAFSAVCPHLGCIVHWNSLEKTFDCPCHGSHFDRQGRCINGPAKGDLQPIPDW
ncbi:oxidoreductase [Micractinium conductrix]|uniref:Oxidoreductase n=1 Tax=Micractinium conductrix TaxID=554055 RepID=A0A2P6V6X3_9CHLO|nr:oxidoreductase [Micractinium conductrix]|eukprot:PSC69844.1 oxidoreductase [Micractinium conductrix]